MLNDENKVRQSQQVLQTRSKKIPLSLHPTGNTLMLHPRPLSHIQVLLLALSLPRLLHLPLLNRFARDSETLNARRHATITRSLQYHFSDLLLRATIVQRTLDVSRKLGAAILTAQHGNVEERASLELEAWAGPD